MRLLGLVRPVKWQFLVTVALGMLNHGSVIILGAFTALLVGAVFREEPLTTLVILVCTLAPLSALLFYLESWQAHDMAFKLLARMRIDLYEKLEPLAPAYMVRRRSGDFVSVVGGDVETVEFFFGHAVSPMIVAILIPSGLLIALTVIAWPIAAVLAPFLIAVAISPFFANTRIERLGDEIRGRMGDIHAYMVDSIQGMREITAFGRGADRTDELTQKGWDYAGHLVRFQKSQAFQIGFMEAMMGLGGLAVLAMGVWAGARRTDRADAPPPRQRARTSLVQPNHRTGPHHEADDGDPRRIPPYTRYPRRTRPRPRRPRRSRRQAPSRNLFTPPPPRGRLRGGPTSFQPTTPSFQPAHPSPSKTAPAFQPAPPSRNLFTPPPPRGRLRGGPTPSRSARLPPSNSSKWNSPTRKATPKPSPTSPWTSGQATPWPSSDVPVPAKPRSHIS